MGLFVSLGVWADVVSINPPSGASTNVVARLTGADSVVVNSGETGGGIVRLNSANTYSGGTTLNSGTLVVVDGKGAKGMSDLGTGDVTLGAATIRYTGKAGGILDKTVTGFAAAATKSCVLDVQNDLVVTGNWDQKYGTFVKTGPGTVTFRGEANCFGGREGTGTTATLNDTTHDLALNANGDGPTAGVTGGFVLAEGTMVIDGDETTTNYINNANAYGSIGTRTTATGTEKSAVLEIRGGQNYMRKPAIPGYHNGNATTGGKGVSSGLRVTGGYLRIGSGVDKKDESVFIGGIDSYTHDTYPFIEVTGGKLEISKNLQLGNQPGANTSLTVSGDGQLELGQYIGNGFTSGPATNTVTIAGNGSIKAQYIRMCSNANTSTCNISLVDNGTFYWKTTDVPFQAEASKTTGRINLFFDGGTVYNCSGTAMSSLNTALCTSYNTDQVKVRVGDRGLTIKTDKRLNLNLPVAFDYTNSVPGAIRQPVNLCGKDNDNRAYYYAPNDFSWDGPVCVGRYAYLYANTDATFAENHDLILARDSRFLNNVTTNRRVKNLQIGEAGVTGGAATLFVTVATPLTVTGELRVPSDTGLIVYTQPATTSWTAGGKEFTTPGDYTVLTVPSASRAALEALTVSYAYANKCKSYFHIADNNSGTLSLKLKIVAVDETTLAVLNGSRVVSSLTTTDAYDTIEIDEGGKLIVTGAMDVMTATKGLTIRLTNGGTLQAANDVGNASTTTKANLYFDGGVYSYVGDAGTKYFRNANFYVGAQGAVFDMTERERLGCTMTGGDLHIAGTWAPDPALAGTGVKDGGITFKGRGIHYLGGTFSSTLEGDLTATDHAELMIINAQAQNQRIVIRSGCALRTYEGNDSMTTLGSLVLGDSGSDVPVVLSANKARIGESKPAFLIKDALTVHSPVYFGERSEWQSVSMTIAKGTYYVLVYKNGTVDASKFQLDPSLSGFEASFEIKEIAEETYADYKAVVATVVAKAGASAPLAAQEWTAMTDGGLWSAPTNWAEGQKAGFAATLDAPQAAGVPVTLDEMPRLRQLTIAGEDPEKGYVVNGGEPLAMQAGTLVELTKRIESFQSDVCFETPVTAEGPLVVANRAGSTVDFAEGLTANGVVNVNDRSGSDRGVSGEVTFDPSSTFGSLLVGTGRVTLDSLGWVKKAADLKINRGTLRYTGTGETVPGLTLVNATSTASVLDVANDLTLESVVADGPSGTGPFIKTGEGVLRFKGTAEFHCGKNNWIVAPSATDPDSSRILPNGDAPTNTVANFSIAAGKVVVGTAGDPNDAPQVIVSSQMAVGLHAGEGASPEFILNNGSLVLQKASLRIGFYDTLGEAMTTPKVTVNGGTVTIEQNMNLPEPYGVAVQNASPTLTVNGGDIWVKGAVRLGYCKVNPAFPEQASTINLNGGTFTTGGIVLGNYDANASNLAIPSYLNLNGGVMTITNELNLSRNVAGTSVVTLNEGATLKVKALTATRTGGTFRFNGGALVVTGASSTDTMSDYLVGAKGAVISTAEVEGGTLTLNLTLKHDPALGATLDGGLIKVGAGTLVIPEGSTFTGPIVVQEGEVCIGSKTLTAGDAGTVVLAAGTVIDCPNAPGAWGESVPWVKGDLIAEGRVYVDFGRTSANPVRMGERYPIAVVDGAVRGRLRLKPLNAGCTGVALDAVVLDGVLYAEVTQHGAAIIIR